MEDLQSRRIITPSLLGFPAVNIPLEEVLGLGRAKLEAKLLGLLDSFISGPTLPAGDMHEGEEARAKSRGTVHNHWTRQAGDLFVEAVGGSIAYVLRRNGHIHERETMLPSKLSLAIWRQYFIRLARRS